MAKNKKPKSIFDIPQITFDAETGVYYFNLYPHKSVLQLDAYKRAIGRFGRIGTEHDPSTGGESFLDIGSDLFAQFYFPETEPLKDEEVPEDRKLSALIMQWFREQMAYAAFQGETYDSIPAASAAAGIAWSVLTDDELIRKILELQEQLAKLLKEFGSGEGQAGDEKSQEQKDGEAALAGVRAKITKLLDQLDKNPFAKAKIQGKIAQAAKQAVEQGTAARDLAESVGWGSEQGNVQEKGLEEILAFMKKNARFLGALVKAIGRAKRTALRAAAYVAPTFTPIATGAYTQELPSIDPAELALLVPPEDENDEVGLALAVMKMMDFMDRGLFGWIQKADKQEEGYFTAAADVSGSISNAQFILTTGTLLGLAKAAREKKRKYSLYKFDTRIVARLKSSEDWQAHLKWTAAYTGGGTEFDPPLDKMAEDIEAALASSSGDHRGMDAVILSDGEADLSNKTKKRWEALQKKGVRLLYIAVGTGTGVLNSLATKTLELHQMNLENADEVAETVGRWLAQ